MTDLSMAGACALGDRSVTRLGYGAVQLAGPMGLGGGPRTAAADGR